MGLNDTIIKKKGLIMDVQVKTTRQGKPYSEGVLNMEGGLSCVWRIWDRDVSNTLKNGDIVEMVGTDDEYNGDVTFIVGSDRGTPLVKVMPNEDINKYLSTAPYSVNAMAEYLKKTVSGLQNEDLKKLCNKVLEKYGEKLCYYPFSHTIHSEKSGMLFHIVTCLGLVGEIKVDRFYKFSPETSPEINLETIKAAIICSCVGFLSSDVRVNNTTGIIESRIDEEMTYSMYGNAWNTVSLSSLICEAGVDVNNPTVANMIHCISYEIGVTKTPLSAEAVFFSHTIRQELEVYSFACERRSSGMIAPDSIIKVR